MKRRDFLSGCVAGLGLALGSEAATETPARRRVVKHTPPAPSHIERICISSWSFHNYFASTRNKVGPPPSRLALLDFPEMIADRYQVHNLEFVAPHFASTDPIYLSELKTGLLSARSRVVNIAVDIDELSRGGGLSDPDAAIHDAAVDACKKWIDIARQIGARSVRCDPGTLDPASVAPSVDSYRKLAAYGRARGITILVENRGEIGSAHPEALVALCHSVGGLAIGALPDFGSFPDDATRQRGLPLLFASARSICHANGLEIDGTSPERKFDFQKCISIAKAAKFQGVYSVEYEGEGDEYAGVQDVVNELMRYL